MRPIEVILPPGSLLDPHKDAAVVGKNKQTGIVQLILYEQFLLVQRWKCINQSTFS